MSQGHADSMHYPVGMVWQENQLVVERVNRLMASEASILHSVMTTAVSAFGKDGGKSANKALTELIKGLSGDE